MSSFRRTPARDLELIVPDEMSAEPSSRPRQAAWPMPIPAPATIYLVAPESLQPAPWNPAGRTKPHAIADLVQSIRLHGFDTFRPILLSHDKIIGDGHRRHAAAMVLHVDQIPVIYTDKTIGELFMRNAGARQVSGHDWMAAHVYGGITIPSRRTANQVEQLTIILGRPGLEWLVDKGIAPDIYRPAIAIGRYVRNTSTAFLAKTIRWMVNQKMIHHAARAVYGPPELRIDRKLLKQAIEGDYALQHAWQRVDA